MRPWRIKICGVTSPQDARIVAAAGADAIGVNFCRQSPRYVEPERAESVLAAVPSVMQKVGVFVNATASEILSCCDQLRLDLIQLHGDEPPELLPELSGRPIVRAFRCGAEGLTPLIDYLHRCEQLECAPQFVLLDALHQGQYGGTGRTMDWDRLEAEIARLGGMPWVLAGGLNPANVAQAIRQLQPFGVDTASGVESAPGRKDPQRVGQFVRAARAAWGEPDQTRR